ncbi:MAG: efflux RND transporter periplasmic adaptor subunit [Pseudomonadota bacterium]|nr:efflux RND transporter periplasmic adaptor subunit [Pseudomonadota bacterium]
MKKQAHPESTADRNLLWRQSLLTQAIRVTVCFLLTACGTKVTDIPKPLHVVRTQTAIFKPDAQSISLTGEVRARTESDLSFRVSGRITELYVDVGSHVEANQLLARIAGNEQQSDVNSAKSSVDSATAEFQRSQAALDRQKALLDQGYTTRQKYDQAVQDFSVAQAALDKANSQLGSAIDTLSFTDLRADFAGMISSRSVEPGEVVQGTATILTIAQDGPRHAVFDVYESLLKNRKDKPDIQVSLLSDPSNVVLGKVSEVSPTLNTATGAVRVKVDLPLDSNFPLGSPVIGSATLSEVKVVVLPWTAMASLNGKPAVWLFNSKTKSVTMHAVDVLRYETGKIIVSDGISEGDTVIIDGAKFLRPGEIVSVDGTKAPL